MQKDLSSVILNEYSKKSLDTLFEWGVSKDCPITIPTELTNYEQNIYLKENLINNIRRNYLSTSYWIINKWGGISGLKQNEKNDHRLINFQTYLNHNRNKLLKDEFSIISSLSKVASFYNPEDFIIYDSRVTYSLNWLIFINNIDTKFFPQPSGRNKELAKYDMTTIFNLSKREIKFFDEKSCYEEYCSLINKTANLGNVKNYNLEMFLFSIAPTDIVKDINNRLSINITN